MGVCVCYVRSKIWPSYEGDRPHSPYGSITASVTSALRLNSFAPLQSYIIFRLATFPLNFFLNILRVWLENAYSTRLGCPLNGGGVNAPADLCRRPQTAVDRLKWLRSGANLISSGEVRWPSSANSMRIYALSSLGENVTGIQWRVPRWGRVGGAQAPQIVARPPNLAVLWTHSVVN